MTQSSSSATDPLAGIHVVVTRPRAQAGRLAALIEQAGGHAILFPVIEILPIAEPAQQKRLAAQLSRLSEFDFAVFISPTAVRQAMPMIGPPPPHLQFAAIGSGTARELRRMGIVDIIAPETAGDSEALLGLPEMAEVAGRRVVIFRGEGGRDLLGETLTRRGAEVEFAECYRRAKPDAGADTTPLFDAWRNDRLHAVIVTSSEGLGNLLEMLGDGGRALLAKTPVFVPHPRIAEVARERGLRSVVLTGPGDEGLLRGLVEWARAGK